MTTETTERPSVALSALPAIGDEFDGGIFAGITTQRDGSHVAVVLLAEKAKDLTWKKAMDWAAKLNAQLPSRPVAALLFANAKDRLDPNWHWTSEEYDASYAWGCNFSYGLQSDDLKSAEGAAVAVRLIHIST